MVVCRCLISCFPRRLLRDCLNDFEMVSVASIINGITYVFIFYIIIIIIIIIIIKITTAVLSSWFQCYLHQEISIKIGLIQL
jgi:hypothetical protein